MILDRPMSAACAAGSDTVRRPQTSPSSRSARLCWDETGNGPAAHASFANDKKRNDRCNWTPDLKNHANRFIDHAPIFNKKSRPSKFDSFASIARS
jgi:hypothetical protein